MPSNSGMPAYKAVAQQMIVTITTKTTIIIVILSMSESEASSEVNTFYIKCVGEQKMVQVQNKFLKCVFISFLSVPPDFCIR